MKQIKFYQYSKCSTCRKAKSFLETHGIDYKDISIIETPPSLSELKKALKAADGNIKKLLNTSGERYRELNLKEKLPKLTVQQILDLLSKNGKLVKRPFAINTELALVGFNEEAWKEQLL